MRRESVAVAAVIMRYEPLAPPSLQSCSSLFQFEPVCMQRTLQYQEPLPSWGSYRPLPPKYGEYHYLPPQRWLHTLKLGGVAFLYHPCANSEQVDLLKSLARSCLNQYVVTPYPHLTQEYVSWELLLMGALHLASQPWLTLCGDLNCQVSSL